jgi:hypothetical protein
VYSQHERDNRRAAEIEHEKRRQEK